jgi:uncharacterized RDD family membrane protein YckC
VSDIPIGTPPSPPGRHAAPGGWYPDPIDATQERYWDGWQWSRTTRPRELPTTFGQQPLAGPPYGQVGYGQQAHSGQQPHVGQQPHSAQQPPQSNGSGQPGAYRAAALGSGVQAGYTEDGVPLSGWWWRALAAFLDLIFLGILGGLLTLPFYRRMFEALATYFDQVVKAAQSGQAPPVQPDVTTLLNGTEQAAVLAIQLGLWLVYYITFVRWKSASPGQLICQLRIVPLDRGRSRERLPWATVIVRALVWSVPGALGGYLLVLWIIDSLFPLWQPKRQALHDVAAKTQVIKPV